MEYPTGAPHDIPLLEATKLGNRRAVQPGLLGLLARVFLTLTLTLLATY